MIKFNIPAFIESLGIMWKGLLGIFIITAIIVLATVILNALTKKRSRK